MNKIQILVVLVSKMNPNLTNILNLIPTNNSKQFYNDILMFYQLKFQKVHTTNILFSNLSK